MIGIGPLAGMIIQTDHVGSCWAQDFQISDDDFGRLMLPICIHLWYFHLRSSICPSLNGLIPKRLLVFWVKT